MKRLWSITGGLLGLLALGALVVVLALTFGGLQRGAKPASQALQSPAGAPTRPPYPPPGTPPLGSPTPPSTPTIQPTPTKWRATPRPTPVRPSGPTPTPLPLPTPAVDVSANIWFLAGSETKQGQVQRDLFYLSVDRAGQPERSGPVHFTLPKFRWSRQGMPRLYPSPAGHYLAVIGASGPLDQITIVDLANHRLLPLHPPALGKVPVLGRFGGWHPDGRHVLYVGSDNYTGLWLVDVENKQPPQYLSEHTPDSAAISPDGQRLIFAGPMIDFGQDKLTAKSMLWLAWADGSHERTIFNTSALSPVFGLSWSPEGSKFVYLKGGGEVWVADADGMNRRRLSTNWASGWGFYPPVWSLDGRYIAFPAEEVPVEDVGAFSEAGAFRHVNIHVIDVHTGEERRLVPDSHVGTLYPTWSPDGSMLAFLSNRSGNPQIWVVGRDGSQLRQLTRTNIRHSAPVWLSQKGGK